MGLFSKKVKDVPLEVKESVDISGDLSMAKTVVEIPAKHRMNYLRKICTFVLRKAEVDDENCTVYFSCEQNVPWAKWKNEAHIMINLPAEYVHIVHADIKSGVRVRMTLEPILEDDQYSMDEGSG